MGPYFITAEVELESILNFENFKDLTEKGKVKQKQGTGKRKETGDTTIQNNLESPLEPSVVHSPTEFQHKVTY